MGRPQFSQSGTEGGGQTLAINNRPEIVHLEETITQDTPDGNSRTLEFQPPEGSAYNMLDMTLFALPPASATSGTHEFRVRTMGQILALYGASAYDNIVDFAGGEWATADDTQMPTSETAQWGEVARLRATHEDPLEVVYGNSTDATSQREITAGFVAEEVTY